MVTNRAVGSGTHIIGVATDLRKKRNDVNHGADPTRHARLGARSGLQE